MEKRFLTRQPSAMPFSHGVVIAKPEKFIILSGQVAFDRHGPERQLVGKDDIAAQTRQVFENIKTLLTEAGATFRDVVELTVYMTDVSQYPIYGKIAQEYVADPAPAQHLIGVAALAFPELMVEVAAVAVQ